MPSNLRVSSSRGMKDRGRGSLKKIMLWVVFGVLAAWLLAGPYGFWRLHQLKAEKKRFMAENAELARENAALQERIRKLETDSKYQEDTVRRELGWVRDGEILYEFAGE